MRRKIFFVLAAALLFCSSAALSFAAPFTNNGNGTVTDTKTELMWQQSEPGYMTWQAALDYCEELTLPSGGPSDWRIPNIKELESIIYDTVFDPVNHPIAIDTNAFPNAVASAYWSSTTYANYPGSAWYVGFSYGGVVGTYKHDELYVRCVRGGLAAACGDGTIDPGEECDDGNTINGDGCSAACQLETFGNLEITKSGTGSGTVTSTDGLINCGDDCTEDYETGTQVELTATSDAGSTFAYWDDGTTNYNHNPLTVEINSDKQITAVFEVATPPCDPPDPTFVYPDDRAALGLFAGSQQAAFYDGTTNVSYRIDPTAVISGIFHKRALGLWFSITAIEYDSTIIQLEPDNTDTIGGDSAAAGIISPDGHANYIIRFCKPGEVTFKLEFDKPAIALTLLEQFVPFMSDVRELAEGLLEIPLYDSAVTNYVQAWQSTGYTDLLRGLFRSVKDFSELARNRQQKAMIVAVFKRFGINITLNALDETLIKVVRDLPKLIIDVWTYDALLAGGKPLELKLVAPAAHTH